MPFYPSQNSVTKETTDTNMSGEEGFSTVVVGTESKEATIDIHTKVSQL